MIPVNALLAYALRQVLGESADRIAAVIERYFADHGRALPRALSRANERAWQALAFALAGDNWLDAVKVFFVSGDAKGVREDIRRFLDGTPFSYPDTPAEFRRLCLAELKQARSEGLLSGGQADGRTIGNQVATLRRLAAPMDLIEGAIQAVGRVADRLQPHCPNLANFLRQRPPGGPPLLAASFVFFFRREIETDPELARGLTFEGLRQLTASQEAALEQLGEALVQLDRIETVVGQTRDAVLDVQVELDCLGRLHLNSVEEVRRLGQEVLAQLGRLGMQVGEIRPRHSFSIRGEDERRMVKQLLARFRQLPAEEQRQRPALLNGLGKLQVGAGDFTGAEQTFATVVRDVDDPAGKAEACHNLYRAALEERKWDEALSAIRQAAELDRSRFAPFPMQRYEVRRILGAGGFGAAFLCFDRYLKAEVVVKTLHAGDLDRTLQDVFGEAQALRLLRHPSIIELLDCNYAAPNAQARPYIVMDYFPGVTLETFLAERGVLSPPHLLIVARQLAEGMQAAHARGVLHRDLKPENVLVRKEGDRWLVKIIDFGLALRRRTIETKAPRVSGEETILGNSVAGTIRYAPPEQMGRLRDNHGRPVGVGPYSDVFAFGKLCCYALFKTTEPKSRHWATSPEHGRWREFLECCIEEELEFRHPNFDPVLAALKSLSAGPLPSPAATPKKPLQASVALNKPPDPLPQPQLQERKAVDEETWPWDGATASITQPEQKAHNVGKLLAVSNDRVTLSLGHGKMEFAWCPPGSFRMGSPPNEPERSAKNDETQHLVMLTKGFWIGVTPVTQAQWQVVMGRDPSRFKGDKLPVECVSWHDCQEFCKRLGEQLGQRLRLPTEAEWEYACRAGTTTPFHFGSRISTDQANYDGSYAYGNGRKGIFRRQTTPVDCFPANAWGLRDLHGNVWEWCQDWYAAYPQEAVQDPVNDVSGDARVVRGGSWRDYPAWCRSTFRGYWTPDLRTRNVGCRVVLCLD